MKVLVAQSCPTLCNSMDCSPPLSMGFSRQEYWSGLPFPSPGDLPDPGIEPRSPALAGMFLTVWATKEVPLRDNCVNSKAMGRLLRWWRSKMWRSSFFPQIHQKYICMWNNSYRIPTECWLKPQTSKRQANLHIAEQGKRNKGKKKKKRTKESG